ncbi:MAG: sugar phosphate isomerase/epimerase [Candidatus Latescibacteria bacterium]|jgi:sugar phosphate isomerase/epimerase|nr:sugar phosphate isomerase/epimerase [Candidatus Latescibacterota bacterium]MBT4140284.1 sugar phosphate isomerase/epimerase [Candidatus Latescibacterota bacterium]
MNLSFSTTACPKAELPEALEICAAAGFDKIELFRTWTESSPVHDDTSVPMVRDRLDTAGVTLTGLNIRNITGRKSDSDERNLGYNLRQVTWDMHLASALRLSSANTKGGQRTDEALEDLIEGVNTALERMEDFTLNLGNHAGNRLEGLDDFKAIMPNVNDRAKILLDTGHLLTAGEAILPFAEAFADRIGLVHLRDQKGETPVPFGEGDLPFDDLIKILTGAGYDGTLVIELEKVTWGEPAEAAATAREHIENLLAS